MLSTSMMTPLGSWWCVSSTDGHASLDELLWQPLPKVDVSRFSRSVQDRDEDRHTHPTTVAPWKKFCEEVKERLRQPDIMVSCFNSFEPALMTAWLQALDACMAGCKHQHCRVDGNSGALIHVLRLCTVANCIPIMSMHISCTL